MHSMPCLIPIRNGCDHSGNLWEEQMMGISSTLLLKELECGCLVCDAFEEDKISFHSFFLVLRNIYVIRFPTTMQAFILKKKTGYKW